MTEKPLTEVADFSEMFVPQVKVPESIRSKSVILQVGKKTIVRDVAQKLKKGGVRVGGVVSREIRTNNVRTGFEFIDLATNDRDILASITGNGPRVGKYYVSLSGCRFAAERLINALVTSEVIICDEIGPMELKSKELVDVVKNLLNIDNKVIVIVVMHQKLEHPLADEFRKKSSSLISINLRNREGLIKTLLDRLSA
jgi:nucleoside-triphosphatase